MGTYTDVCSVLKPAKRGSAEIRIDTPSGFERLSGALHGQPLDREKYAQLLINGRVMMTDAEFERRTNIEFGLCGIQCRMMRFQAQGNNSPHSDFTVDNHAGIR